MVSPVTLPSQAPSLLRENFLTATVSFSSTIHVQGPALRTLADPPKETTELRDL